MAQEITLRMSVGTADNVCMALVDWLFDKKADYDAARQNDAHDYFCKEYEDALRMADRLQEMLDEV